jgi:pyridoxamine 5'-phosphate oxidase
MTIAELRREYNLTGLRRKDLEPEPIAQFKRWFDQASGARASGRVHKFLVNAYKTLMLIPKTEQIDLTALTLATVDKEGRPSARTVLLKGVDQRGFTFYTNYLSRKGQDLEANPNAALVFYWSELERQVCVAGVVSKLPPEESDAYFRTRPYGSRLAAWASDQSSPVADRATLQSTWKQFEAQYPGPEVPRPSNWGGYVLAPVRVEFWQGRPNRLHDRFRYTRQPDSTWQIERLSP